MNLQLLELVFRQVLLASFLASLLAAIVWLVQRLLGSRLDPGWRHALWLVVLLRLVTPGLPSSPLSLWNAPLWMHLTASKPTVKVTFSNEAKLDLNLLRSTPISEGLPVTPLPAKTPFRPTLLQSSALAWLGITCLLLLRLALASFWLRLRLWKTAHAPNPEFIHALAEARARVGTVWNPRVLESASIDSPGLFGCLRPKLLLPAGLTARLTPVDLRHIFLHELVHLRRADLWTNLLMTLAHAFHWFNPVVWFLLRRLRLERELACDALVLRSSRGEEPRVYGETILKLLDRVAPTSPFSAVVGILEEKEAVASRLAQIASFPTARPVSGKLGLALLLVLALVGLSNAQDDREDSKPLPVDAVEQKRASPGVLPASRKGYETIQEEYAQQKVKVDQLEEELDHLRLQLGVSADVITGSTEALLAKDRIAAQTRYMQSTNLLARLKGLTRAELRQVLPTVTPDAALDRYLKDLALLEQQYASDIKQLGPDHSNILKLVELKKTINRQIDERLDGILQGLGLQVEQNQALVEELRKLSAAGREQDSQARAKFRSYFETKGRLESERRSLDTLYKRLLGEAIDSAIAPQATENQAGLTNLATTSAPAGPLIQDARLLMELGKLDEAQAKLAEARKLDPDDRAALYYSLQLSARKANRLQEQGKGFTSAGRSNILQKIQGIHLTEFHLSAGEKMSDAVAELSRQIRDADPSKTGINFVFSSPKASQFTFPTDSTLSPSRAVDILNGIVASARSPAGDSPDPAIQYFIEDYAVVFTEYTPPALYTRSYKVNPRVLLENIGRVLGKNVDGTGSIVEGIRTLCNQAGTSFAATTSQPFDQGQPLKALFYNDRTGVLMARSTLTDLDIIETVLHVLNITPPQISLATQVVDLIQPGSFDLLSFVASKGTAVQLSARAVVRFAKTDAITFSSPATVVPPTPSGDGPDFQAVLSAKDFDELVTKLKQASGVHLLAAPNVTTLSSRQARVSIDPGPTIDLTPVAQADGQNIRLITKVGIPIEGKQKAEALNASAEGMVPDGDALVIYPRLQEGRAVVVFITPTLIDPAGNRIRPPSPKLK